MTSEELDALWRQPNLLLKKDWPSLCAIIELARIGATTKAAAERDGVERAAMASAIKSGSHRDAQAAAAALVAHAKGESDGQAG